MSKVTIQGVPRQYSVDDLQVRQQQVVKTFLETGQSLYILHKQTHGQFFDSLAELILKGYKPANERLPVIEASSYTMYLRKPQSILDVEIAALEHKVKLEYIQSLELERTEYEAKLVAQMMQADQQKEAKAMEAKQAKKLAEYKLIAANTFTPLQLPETERAASV